MVAAPNRVGSGVNGLSQYEEPKGAKRNMWPPRSGRSAVFKKWKYDVEDHLSELGIESIEDALKLEAPSDDALAQHAEDGVWVVQLLKKLGGSDG